MTSRTLGLKGATVAGAIAILTIGSAMAASAQSAAPAGSAAAGAKGMICVIVPPVSNPFFGAMQQIAADKAVALGYTTTRLVHDDDANKQLELFESCISSGAKAIILDNAGADATVAAVQRAKDAGVPSFLVDREMTKEGVAVSQIVSNNAQGAAILGEEFARLMGETGTYIELTGKDTDTNAHVRSQGYHLVLDALPDMKMLTTQTANWDQNEGFNVTQQLLSQYPDVKGIIAGNDTMALGAQAAVLAANKPGIIVVGFDGSDDAIKSIHQGQLKATSLQPVAAMATEAAVQADQYITTGSTGKDEKQSIDMVLLTPDNACQYYQFAPVAEGQTSADCQ